MAAFKLAALAVPLVAGAMAAAAACTSSGNLVPADAGDVIVDGSVLTTVDGQPVSAAGYACAFEERATYTCPDETLAPTPWQTRCVDNDDCRGRVNGNQTVAGCTVAIEYAETKLLTTSCAAWSATGGTLPALDSGALPVCAAGNTTFTPTWHPPHVVAGACTKTLIDSYRQCLNDSQTTLSPASCAPWTGTLASANQTCLSCLVSDASDATYGPIVMLPSEAIVNLPGCLAATEGKTDGSGCGGALSAYEECARAACLPTCPTGTTAEISAEAACETASQTGVCQSFVTPAQCADAIQNEDAGTAAEGACFGSDSNAELEAVALVLCGG